VIQQSGNEVKRELERARGEAAVKDQEIERLRQRLEEAEGGEWVCACVPLDVVSLSLLTPRRSHR
jgi:hypothetical protein